MRGNLSDIGRDQVWVMSDVLYRDNELRPDRREWFEISMLYVEIVVILSLTDDFAVPHPVSTRRCRNYRDAQLALSRDPRPLFLITEEVDEPSKDTFAFYEGILRRYNIVRR